MSPHLHIISFNIPFPANYGGVIDVFYKLKTLHQMGVQIHLHCYGYGRSESRELEQYCYQVYYYPRQTGIHKQFSTLPYIVNTRQSETLIHRLLQDNHPILFEGLHTCYYLSDARLANRLKIYRESNIEHEYYSHLCKAEGNWFKKAYYWLEAQKLKAFEKQLSHANMMLVVSTEDRDYLQQKFPRHAIHYVPSFHPNEQITAQPGVGQYILYHGNLSVAENYLAASFLIREVFSSYQVPFIIAGLNPADTLINLVAQHPHIQLVANPSDEALSQLLEQAQIHVLITFQATGLKLKLLNVLYSGRYCLVNSSMLIGTGLDPLCIVANTADEMTQKIKEYLPRLFSDTELEKRKSMLAQRYSNTENGKLLYKLVFGVDHSS